jgi:hypothetical protein
MIPYTIVDFGILVDVNDALTKGDSFTAQEWPPPYQSASLLLFLTGCVFLILKGLRAFVLVVSALAVIACSS